MRIGARKQNGAGFPPMPPRSTVKLREVPAVQRQLTLLSESTADVAERLKARDL